MTFRKSVLAALGTVAVVGIWMPQASQAAVPVMIPRPVINIPKPALPAVKPVIPTVRPVVATIKPILPAAVHAVPAVKPPTVSKPAVSAPTAPRQFAAHTPATTSAPAANNTSAVPSWWKAGGGVPIPPDHVALPPNAVSSVTAIYGGKPAIKVSFVNGNAKTDYFLSPDFKHIEGVISSTSAAPLPGTHAPPQNVATAQPSQPSSSGQKITATPVSYPEIKDAYNRPIGYVNAQGQNVYFPNGQIPSNFVVGPNNTIQTYITTVSSVTPPSHPAPAPAPVPAVQPPSSSQPAANSIHKTVWTPVSYPEIKDAYNRPVGYVNAQGQSVYFPNGQMPLGFFTGPNNTVTTYIKSTT